MPQIKALPSSILAAVAGKRHTHAKKYLCAAKKQI